MTFVFFHYGGIPRYLRASIESVRFFNPDSRILLVCDSTPQFSQNLRVQTYELERFESAALKAFRKAYIHVSVFPEKYERFVLERWFLLEEMIRTLGLDHTVVLDSDVMVFCKVDGLFEQIPDKPFSMASMSPHFTLIRSSVKSFLNHIMGRYEDAYYIAHARERFAEALARGGLQNLGEMEFVAEHMTEGTEACPYPTLLKEGHIDGNIHLPDRYQTVKVGRRKRKKVFWKFEDGKYLPSFREQDTNHLVPAAILHFQGGSKRLIHRFNPLDHSPLLPPSFRLPYLHFLFNRSFHHAL